MLLLLGSWRSVLPFKRLAFCVHKLRLIGNKYYFVLGPEFSHLMRIDVPLSMRYDTVLLDATLDGHRRAICLKNSDNQLDERSSGLDFILARRWVFRE